MNRIAGIAVAVAGVLLIVLGATKTLPGMTGKGVGIFLLGGLIIGLSFVRGPESEGAERMSTGETLLSIFYAPTEVFQNLRRHPRWLIAVLVMSVLSAVYSNAFFYQVTPERIVSYTIDKTLQMSILNDEARRRIEEGRAEALADAKNPVSRAGTAVVGFAGTVFLIAFLAAVFFLFSLAMGGTLNYMQAFSATAYALFPVWVIRQVLNLIILFIKDPTDIHPLLGQTSLVQDNLNFLANPAESPVLFSLLTSLSILSLYWIWLQVTGLKNAGERVTSTIAWSAVITIWLIGVVFGVVMAFMFPSFLS